MKWACLHGLHLTPDEVKAMASCPERLRQHYLEMPMWPQAMEVCGGQNVRQNPSAPVTVTHSTPTYLTPGT